MPAKKKAAKKRRSPVLTQEQQIIKGKSLKLPKDINAAIDALIPKEVKQQDRDDITLMAGNKAKISRWKRKTDIVRAVLGNVVRSRPVEQAAYLAGITPKTWYEWCEKWPALRDAAKGAEALMSEDLLDVIYESLHKHPRLALDLLERRQPHHFASRQNQAVQVQHQHQLSGEALALLGSYRQQADEVVIDAEVIPPEQLPVDSESTAAVNDISAAASASASMQSTATTDGDPTGSG